jgi:hypothetical protein
MTFCHIMIPQDPLILYKTPQVHVCGMQISNLCEWFYLFTLHLFSFDEQEYIQLREDVYESSVYCV